MHAPHFSAEGFFLGLSMKSTVGYHIEKDPVKHLTALLLDSVRLMKDAQRPFFETLDDPRKRPESTVAAFEEAKGLVPRIVGASNNVDVVTREADYFFRLVAYIVSENGSSLGSVASPQAASAAKAIIGLFHGANRSTPLSVERHLWNVLSSVSGGVKTVQSQHVCAACNQPLGTGSHTLYRSNVFHPACFACHKCRSPLLLSFNDDNNVLTCDRCSH